MSIVTAEFRVSFPNLDQPKAFEGQEAKYSMVMLFPKATNDLKDIQEIAWKAICEKWPDEATRNAVMAASTFKNPLRDGDVEKPGVDGYAGHWFVACNSKQKPGMVDANLQPIITPGAIYAGCYARASVNAYAFDRAGNKGVGLGLHNIMKTREGEAFSGRATAEEDFKAFAGQAQQPMQNSAPMGQMAPQQPMGNPNMQSTGFPSQAPAPVGQPMQQPAGLAQQPQQPMAPQNGYAPAPQAPVGQPMQQPVGQPMQQPVGQPMQQPVGQPMQQPVGQPMQQPVGQPQWPQQPQTFQQ